MMHHRNQSLIQKHYGEYCRNWTILLNDFGIFRVSTSQGKPMVILLAWLLANPKHIHKYLDPYIEQGFDALVIRRFSRDFVGFIQILSGVNLWQALLPAGTNGIQAVAKDIVKFLYHNQSNAPLAIHGFSIGLYIWCEVMNHMLLESDQYQPILDRIGAQTWDSGFLLFGNETGNYNAKSVDTLQISLILQIFVRALELHSFRKKDMHNFFCETS